MGLNINHLLLQPENHAPAEQLKFLNGGVLSWKIPEISKDG